MLRDIKENINTMRRTMKDGNILMVPRKLGIQRTLKNGLGEKTI